MQNEWTEKIAALEAERDSLKAWKESAMAVESKWDRQAVAKEIGVPLGKDIVENILPWIQAAKAELEKVKAERDEAIGLKNCAFTVIENMQVWAQERYTRESIRDNDLAAKTAECERLREALEEIEGVITLGSRCPCAEIAKAALAGEGGKE